MALKFRCKECRYEIVVRFLKASEKKTCPVCGAKNVIPEDAVLVDDVLKKSLKEAKAGNVVAEVSWKRRGLAFLIDYTIFGALWGVIDNLVAVPVSEALMSIGKLAIFCLYFGLTEGINPKRASPGKRLLGLAVSMRDGLLPSATVVTARAAILGLIVVLDWPRVISLILLGEVPLQVYVLGLTVPAGLMLYNAWLGFRGTEGLMLQDGLSYSKVIKAASVGMDTATEGSPVQQHRRREWPRPKLCLVLVVVISVLGLAFFQYVVMAPELVKLSRDLERALAANFGVRVRVKVQKGFGVVFVVGGDNGERTRSLDISVWVPYKGWNEELVQGIANASIRSVAREGQGFDCVKLEVSTGLTLLSLKKTFEIEPAKLQSLVVEKPILHKVRLAKCASSDCDPQEITEEDVVFTNEFESGIKLVLVFLTVSGPKGTEFRFVWKCQGMSVGEHSYILPYDVASAPWRAWLTSSALRPGDYGLDVIINDQVVKNLEFKIVE